MAKKGGNRKSKVKQRGGAIRGIPIDKGVATITLDHVFQEVETQFQRDGQKLTTGSAQLDHALEAIFDPSTTQAYREALIGCCLARLADRRINIRLPYVKQAENAFSGRSLDEAVVNPFFKRHRIPSSKGPYLSSIRRNAKLLPEQEDRGLMHPVAFRALMTCLDHLQKLDGDDDIKGFLMLVLNRFAVLRQESQVALVQISRLSLKQLNALIDRLLASASGGRWPVILCAAMFRTIAAHWNLDWTVECQGINVADAPSGAAGDVTIRQADRIVLAAEVTERRVDRTRVITTFNAKIADAKIGDYIFFAAPDEESGAERQAQQYFAQGHEINFVDLFGWLHNLLATIGPEGRRQFVSEVLQNLQADDTPGALKVTWNSVATDVASGDAT
jgi:hypothetical protein